MPERSPLQIDPKDLLWTPDYDPLQVSETGAAEFLGSIDENTVPHYEMRFVSDGVSVRREMYAALDPQRFADPDVDTVLILTGHGDDELLLGGRNKVVSDAGYATVMGTITDGRNRAPDRLPPLPLANGRLQEQLNVGDIDGTSVLVNFGIEDGTAAQRFETVVNLVGTLVDAAKPIAILTPHPHDRHSDHATVYEAAVIAAGDIPVIASDTPTMRDRDGRQLEYTHQYPMSKDLVIFRDAVHDRYPTQRYGHPLGEMREINMVRRQPSMRGEQLRYPSGLGGVLYTKSNIDNHPDPRVAAFVKHAQIEPARSFGRR